MEVEHERPRLVDELQSLVVAHVQLLSSLWVRPGVEQELYVFGLSHGAAVLAFAPRRRRVQHWISTLSGEEKKSEL